MVVSVFIFKQMRPSHLSPCGLTPMECSWQCWTKIITQEAIWPISCGFTCCQWEGNQSRRASDHTQASSAECSEASPPLSKGWDCLPCFISIDITLFSHAATEVSFVLFSSMLSFHYFHWLLTLFIFTYFQSTVKAWQGLSHWKQGKRGREWKGEEKEAAYGGKTSFSLFGVLSFGLGISHDCKANSGGHYSLLKMANK